MNMEKELKEELGLDNNSKIPADFSIPYLVHQDDMNKMDMSHRRIEKWLFILCLVIFLALVATNIFWIHYENQFEDVVTETYTAESDNGGTAIANGDGSVSVNGESNLHKEN